MARANDRPSPISPPLVRFGNGTPPHGVCQSCRRKSSKASHQIKSLARIKKDKPEKPEKSDKADDKDKPKGDSDDNDKDKDKKDTSDSKDAAKSDKDKDGPQNLRRARSPHRAEAVDNLRGDMRAWFLFYDGFQPEFSWWLKKPNDEASKAFEEYSKFPGEEIGLKGKDALRR